MDDKTRARPDTTGCFLFVGSLCISIAVGYLEGKPTGFLIFGSYCILRAAVKYLFNRKRFEQPTDGIGDYFESIGASREPEDK